MGKNDLKSMDAQELIGFMKELGQPAFRGKQIFEWLHKKQVNTIEEMSNLPKTLREKLEERTSLFGVKQLEKLVSQEDGTTKYLFGLENGSIIESVLMKYGYGNTACISTQAGCRMGCTFCASTLDGIERNLTAGEMLSQVYEMQKDGAERISGIVLMGSGEPLDNYDQVMQFLRMANDPNGLGLGQRHITLSTCGLIERVYDLAKEDLQITLAVSLHAPNDEIRNRIMPISKSNPMGELLGACKYYGDTTKRRVTFEYALIKGINDSPACARELAGNLKGMLCHVNLIPVNDVKERNYERSSNESIQKFADILLERGVTATIRRKLGSDINAACGQLRKSYQK